MTARLRWAYRRLYEGVNYRLRFLAGGRLASRCRPTSIIFLLTERCNARCLHCDIWQNRGREDSPAAEQWKQVLSDLRSWLGPVYVAFSGGEALLKPFTVDLVRHANSLGLFLEILTHGWWQDQSHIEQLALANPWRITVSLDGLGETHSKIRGREDFFENTSRSIDTLLRVRAEQRLGYEIRLKTVVMEHNLGALEQVARFATRDGVHVFYQPIEQNYNAPQDVSWFLTSPNWPRDVAQAVAAIERLIALKREGLHIANSDAQLEAMIPYFRDPAGLKLVTQFHSAHERRAACSALTMLQFQANGDVRVCATRPPVGNIRETPIRRIWERRPRWWETGCCLEQPSGAASDAASDAASGAASGA